MTATEKGIHRHKPTVGSHVNSERKKGSSKKCYLKWCEQWILAHTGQISQPHYLWSHRQKPGATHYWVGRAPYEYGYSHNAASPVRAEQKWHTHTHMHTHLYTHGYKTQSLLLSILPPTPYPLADSWILFSSYFKALATITQPSSERHKLSHCVYNKEIISTCYRNCLKTTPKLTPLSKHTYTSTLLCMLIQ